jgi:hypothetical protein
MTASLEGPRLKLDRAREHREQLEMAVDRFTQTEQQKVTIEHEAGTRLWVIEEPGEVPPEYGPLISDTLHNLRSALDYLATQLVIANNPRAGLSDVAFPIYDNITEYVERGLPKIKRMSEPVQAAIELTQPYHRPNTKWETDRLLLLNRLNNDYKHSAFKLVVATVKGMSGYGVPDGIVPNWGPLEDRTILAAWPDEDPEVEVHWSVHFDVVFAESPWGDSGVCQVLREIESKTRKVTSEIAEVGGLAS